MKDGGDFADGMNGLPKYVVSTSLGKAEWNNSTVIKAKGLRVQLAERV